MINSDFLKKDLELVAPPHFEHDFQEKIFLMLYSINWLDFIVWLSLLFEISGNMFIVIVCCPVCDVMNFEIYLSLSSRFPKWPKRQNKNLNITRTKRAFKAALKSIFHHFKRAFRCQTWQSCTKNVCFGVSFLIKFQAWGLQLYLKRNYSTGVFLWILQNF